MCGGKAGSVRRREVGEVGVKGGQFGEVPFALWATIV